MVNIQNHRGNTVPSIIQEEHATVGGVDAKKVMVFDNAGNQIISFGGGSGNVTVTPQLAWPDPKAYIGLVSISGAVSFGGNVTLNPSPNYIGLATIIPASAWPDPKTYIGLATIDIGTNNSVGIKGNVTLSDPKGFIGLVSIAQPISTTFSGNVTLDPGSFTGIKGNVTLSDSKGFIGLTTVTGSVGVLGNVTLSDPKGFIGLTTVTGNVGILGNVTLSGSPSVQAFGQFFTTPQSIASGGLGPLLLDQFGRMQVVPVGNVTITDSKGFIGLVTVGNTPNVAITGNVTLIDPKNFIGLVTVTEGTPYSSPSVVIGMTSAASGALVQFAANVIKWVELRSSDANATTIYVGGSNATINNGFPLNPGDTLGISIANTNQLYLVGVGTSEVRFLAGI